MPLPRAAAGAAAAPSLLPSLPLSFPAAKPTPSAPPRPAVYKVWPARSWFLPCQWWERSCRRETYKLLSIGQMNFS